MNGPIEWFARNPVAANLLLLLMIAGGVAALPTIQQKIFPDIDVDIISVWVAHLGAAPEEVEEGIILAIEELDDGTVPLAVAHQKVIHVVLDPDQRVTGDHLLDCAVAIQ